MTKERERESEREREREKLFLARNCFLPETAEPC